VAPATTRGEPITVRGFDPLTPDAAAPVEQGTTGHTGGASLLISFMSNSTNLTPAAKAALDQLGKALRSEQLAAYRFQVEGHADPRGPSDVNMRLSTERAQAVVQYLSSVGGVAPERLTAVGRGSTQPMNRHNPAAPENRRVTIITVQ
jgi:outer membrane protein OmpA-like peptidoglycan-associated protein